MEPSQLVKVFRPHFRMEQQLEKGVLAAVLVVIHFREGEPFLLLTKRSSNLKNHAGEISCPGGTQSNSDKDLMRTAIRETCEEIGIRIDEKQISGALRAVHTLTSNFTIVPYLAIVDTIDSPKPDNKEIAEVIDVPLFDLLRTIEPDIEHAHFGEVYKFKYNGNIVWGATARILKQLYDILRVSGMI